MADMQTTAKFSEHSAQRLSLFVEKGALKEMEDVYTVSKAKVALVLISPASREARIACFYCMPYVFFTTSRAHGHSPPGQGVCPVPLKAIILS